MERKASDEIKDLLDFLRDAEPRYRTAVEAVKTEDRRTQDLLHKIELKAGYKERNRLATQLKHSRVTRRKNKDVAEELDPIVEFLSDRNNKRAVDQLTQLLGKLRKVEKYHENRTYYPRVEK